MSVLKKLKQRPAQFDTATALRIAQHEAAQSGRVVTAIARPNTRPSPHAIQEVSETPEAITVETPIFGLLGPLSPLPMSYSQSAARQESNHAHGMTAFLSIFSDRLTWLFVDVSEKYNMPRLLQWSPSRTNTILNALRALIGLGGPNLNTAAPLPDDQTLRYAGQLAQQTRSAIGLESVLSAELSLPVAVNQFHLRWRTLPAVEQSQMSGGIDMALGAIAGGVVPDRTSQIMITIGPMRYPDFLSLEEGQERLTRIRRLTRYYIGPVLDFELQIVLDKRDVPQTQLGGDGPAIKLGWNAWAKNSPSDRDSTEATLGERPRSRAT